ncbi:C-type mannose receptor [Actinidia rufa]|uniref:C-type mannose receptor n=1 Tax=Actinidia rufa TaxID=165716 RepID=A0A7J0DJM5_9ERIC|nr:C-type mannose receptor [Actinidia rufa]
MGGSRGGGRRERWCVQALTPLMEGPDLEMQDEYLLATSKKAESSWEIVREWFRVLQRNNAPSPAGRRRGRGRGSSSFSMSMSLYNNNIKTKRQDLRLLLGVLGCPLAPIPIPTTIINPIPIHLQPPHFVMKDIPIENSRAYYIIQQYLAATGCLKQQQQQQQQRMGSDTTMMKNMYATGVVKMICCETEICSGNGKGVKSIGTRSSGENGCFVLWQMNPGMWSLELVLGTTNSATECALHNNNNKVIAGSNGKIVWRHTPWLGTHAAKGPLRPLRRLIQGLDPKSTARLFGEAQCLGEKRIGDEDCFVLKVAADWTALMERNEGAAESDKARAIRLLQPKEWATNLHGGLPPHQMYWETTIGSSIGDYREVNGLLIAHEGRTIATVFRFGEQQQQGSGSGSGDGQHEYYSRTRMEETWRIDDVVFNVPGLSLDSFLPPSDIFHAQRPL